MSDLYLRLPDPQAATPPKEWLPLGRVMVNAGIISQPDLVHALNLQRHIDAPLGEILVAEGLAHPDEVLQMLSRQHNVPVADLRFNTPDHELAHSLPSQLCLEHRCVPWMKMGNALLVATSHPENFNHLKTCLGDRGRHLLPVLIHDRYVRQHISALYGAELVTRAANRVPISESCRTYALNGTVGKIFGLSFLSLVLMSLVIVPMWALTTGMVIAFITLMMTTTLKVSACIAQLKAHFRKQPIEETAGRSPFPLPKVSIMVPLLQENEIAGKLIQRLTKLTYPKSLLEVVLVLEADDTITRETIARTDMPSWMSVIEVPSGDDLKTKPRALNYALDFCRGSIIGVWDAEDAPEPEQIEKIVTRFQDAPPNVACLQGILDFYNTRANWISRCFTIEYATWWRVILPGVAKLGLVVPLGGTTLFFRRNILEDLCGWDAYNVTEDADLGIRLARHGYVTELIPTVTYEEANCRVWPWIKQRSRWLKGYLITWMVHMRTPRALLRDLGLMRFLGVQTLLLATFAQFAMVPFMWSFWIMLAGFDHATALTLGPAVTKTMAWMCLGAFIIDLGISMVAVSRPQHRHLMKYVLTLPFYFPMAAVSAYKALREMVFAPFYWDKTEHGVVEELD